MDPVGDSCKRLELETRDCDEAPLTKRSRSKLHGFEFFRSIGSPKFVCAPMVDQSELAFRMLVRRYGCSLAYTPMLHSRNFAESATYRSQNFSTCPEDRPLFVQFCGDNPRTLVDASKYVQAQCNAVDINLGCPQGIARKGHYGAYLLEEADLVCSMVSSMHAELEVPVTCKIRLLKPGTEDLQSTLNFCYGIQAAGCSLITLHGRTKEMKGQHAGAADWEACKIVKNRIDIPLFVNGGIETFADVERCMAQTGCDGVMSSEALLETPSLFSGRRVLQDDLTAEYLELAKVYDARHSAVKAHLFRFLYAGLQVHTDIRGQLGAAKGLESISDVAAKLRARRATGKNASGGEEAALPDIGWYLRYRRPLGDRDQSRAERKAKASVTDVAASQMQAEEAGVGTVVQDGDT